MASIRKRTYKAPDGTTRKSLKWYIRYKDADGAPREVSGFKDKEATKQLAAKLQRESELGQAGVRDPFVKHRKRPLSEHIADYREFLTNRDNTADHVNLTLQRVQSVIDRCEFLFIADLSASRVQEFLGELRTNGKSIATSNHYLRAAKSFSRWMMKDRRMGEDPLGSLSMLNAKADRRRIRRPLSEADMGKLITAARSGKKVRGLTGLDRAMLYLIACYTGLRASELASLTRDCFDLTSPMPTVSVTAGYSKRRREDVLPFHPSLLADVGSWLATKTPGATIWPGKWASDKGAGKMLRVDLKAAGIPYFDDARRVVDFHSLRHTFITRLGRAGVSVQQAKELARHSNVNLTLNTYTHLELHDATSAIASLPNVATTSHEVAVTHGGTGTEDGSPLIIPLTTLLTTNGDFSSLETARTGKAAASKTDLRSKRQVSSATSVSDDWQGLTVKGVNEDDGARTRNLRIDSPVL